MPSKAKADPAVKRCIDAFYAAYVRHHNAEFAEQWLVESAAGVPVGKRTTPQSKMILPMISGKDASLIVKMLATWGEERVLTFIADFFGVCYMQHGAYNSNQDIGALFKMAPRLQLRDRGQTIARRTANNLDAARRAMGQQPSRMLQLPPGRKHNAS